MNIAYVGELRTSSRCGRLDQACAFGVKPNLMTFDGDEIEVRSLNVKKQLYWVFADLCAEKDTIRILSDLNKAYPFPNSDAERAEHEALGENNLEIVDRAIKYMAEGDAEGLVNIPQQIKNLRLSISLREDMEKPDTVWVSLRSVDDFPCNQMAEQFFNGGGHLNASGGHLDCSINEAIETVKRAIAAFGDMLK